jgi:hypothetical protein
MKIPAEEPGLRLLKKFLTIFKFDVILQISPYFYVFHLLRTSIMEMLMEQMIFRSEWILVSNFSLRRMLSGK